MAEYREDLQKPWPAVAIAYIAVDARCVEHVTSNINADRPNQSRPHILAHINMCCLLQLQVEDVSCTQIHLFVVAATQKRRLSSKTKATQCKAFAACVSGPPQACRSALMTNILPIKLDVELRPSARARGYVWL